MDTTCAIGGAVSMIHDLRRVAERMSNKHWNHDVEDCGDFLL